MCNTEYIVKWTDVRETDTSANTKPSSPRQVLTWSLQFALAAGQIIKTEVHKQNMTEICYDSSNAKEPAQTLVEVLRRSACSSITHKWLNSCNLNDTNSWEKERNTQEADGETTFKKMLYPYAVVRKTHFLNWIENEQFLKTDMSFKRVLQYFWANSL